jgi:hypothetical protein
LKPRNISTLRRVPIGPIISGCACAHMHADNRAKHVFAMASCDSSLRSVCAQSRRASARHSQLAFATGASTTGLDHWSHSGLPLGRPPRRPYCHSGLPLGRPPRGQHCHSGMPLGRPPRGLLMRRRRGEGRTGVASPSPSRPRTLAQQHARASHRRALGWEGSARLDLWIRQTDGQTKLPTEDLQ